MNMPTLALKSDVVLHRHAHRLLLRKTQATFRLGRPLIFQKFRDTSLGEQGIKKLLVFVRNKVFQRLLIQPAFFRTNIVGWHQQINAVRNVTQLFINPLQINLQSLISMQRCPKHPKATRLTHRNNNVAAMRKGKKRICDAKQFGDVCRHFFFLVLLFASRILTLETVRSIQETYRPGL